MNGLLSSAARWMRRLGWPGIVGLGFAAYAAMFFATAVVPAQTGLEQLRQQAAAREALVAQLAREGGSDAQGPESRLTRFYAFFPQQDTAAAWLEKIYAAAGKQALGLQTGEYRFVPDGSGKLGRYEITLPVKGPYVQVRKFIADVLTEIPVAALEDVRIRRDTIGSDVVEAKIKFALYLRVG